MKKIKTTKESFKTYIDSVSLTNIRFIHICQILFLIPYSTMYIVLYKGHNSSQYFSNLSTILMITYITFFPCFYYLVKTFYIAYLKKTDISTLQLLVSKRPEHSALPLEGLYLLQIQKAINIFYMLLNIYSLVGAVSIIVFIKNGTIYNHLFLWIYLLPFTIVTIHSITHYPNRKNINIIFKNYIYID